MAIARKSDSPHEFQEFIAIFAVTNGGVGYEETETV